jgi:hypothetical protein
MLEPYLPPLSPDKQLGDAIMRLQSGRDVWLQTTLQERIDLLTVCLSGLELEAKEWVLSACRARRYSLGGPEEGEEWLTGPVALMRYLRLLIRALESEGQPPLPGTLQRGEGQWVAEVFPSESRERALMPGVSGEVWMTPGADIEQGRIYRDRSSQPQEGRLCLVLGGGGVTSASPIDALYKMFAEDQVVLLKLSPLDAAIGPYIARAFWKFIELGFFTLVYGDEETGAKLAARPEIDTVHLTGSAETRQALEDAGVRLDTVSVGGVNPIIVVPGEWSEDELAYQARQVATMVGTGGGASCAAAQSLLLPSGWPQRERFVTLLEEALSRLPCRPPIRPDAETAHRALQEHYPQARLLGAGVGLPWMVIPDVPAHSHEPILTKEYPFGVVGIIDVVARSTEDFLAAAVRLCNTSLPGEVCASLLVCAAALDSNRSTVERAIGELEYGVIGLNIWPGVAMGLSVGTWGGKSAPSRSGFLLDHPHKTVFRAPAHLRATPIWFVDRPGMARMGPSLASFAAEPRWRKVPRILLASRTALMPWRRSG